MYRLKNIFLLGLLIISIRCSAQNSYLLSKDYSIKILGTSSLHKWDETVGIASGYIIASRNNDGGFNLDAVEIKMDVKSIKSENSAMTNKTLVALKADSNPEITFVLDAPVKSIQVGAETIISAKGKLTIADVTKEITMEVKINTTEKGKLQIQGSEPIKMSDYNIRPPKALLGTLKTGNDITVDFKMSFTLSN